MIARVITRSPNCPTLQVDGRSVVMNRRAAPVESFPETVCEHRVPRTTRQITLEEKRLPTVKPDVRRIVVIGDTGCRIRRGKVQACNNPVAWPLRTIMADIAAKAPDLVIHVGDYLYRSMVCPVPEKCNGSPYGDNFQTWSTDWLDPAQGLFSHAPFVFLRGNHESCGRGDKGWFRYFAPRSIPADCPAVTEPWTVSVNGLDLIAFDASAGPAPESSPALLHVYRRMAENMFANVSRETWFLTHRPLWVNMHAFGELIDGDDTQRAAFGAAMPEFLSLILSGHIHAFQAIDLANGPVQWISGNSGTLLDPMPTGMVKNIEVAGSLARTVVNDNGFGFLMLTREETGGWWMDAIDVNGDLRHRCRLMGRTLSCDAQ
ncbi:MAG: metallophosphoesterase [Hyphomicrobiales bacterium]|nr:metallophosphoesterase [Hyphomicrobiales bacterium]